MQVELWGVRISLYQLPAAQFVNQAVPSSGHRSRARPRRLYGQRRLVAVEVRDEPGDDLLAAEAQPAQAAGLANRGA